MSTVNLKPERTLSQKTARTYDDLKPYYCDTVALRENLGKFERSLNRKLDKALEFIKRHRMISVCERDALYQLVQETKSKIPAMIQKYRLDGLKWNRNFKIETALKFDFKKNRNMIIQNRNPKIQNSSFDDISMLKLDSDLEKEVFKRP